MLDETLIQKLKQTNISKDGEKTKQRVKELWDAASKEQKQTIEKLAGVARSTVYRIYKSGSISAKLTVPIAQTLNVNPFYLTGEADQRGECTDELLMALFEEYGYKKLLTGQTKKRQRQNAAPKEEALAQQESNTAEQSAVGESLRTEEYYNEQKASVTLPIIDSSSDAASVVSGASRDFLDNLSEEDMILLLRSIMLRAKSGNPATAQLAEKLKLLLLS